MRHWLFILIVIFGSNEAFSQGLTRQTFHDSEKKNLKEVYQVKDSVKNILHGRYIAYYLNGNVESKGQFANNEATGVWEFFYETGNLKMRGIVRQNENFGLWEYFYESGQKSMEGTINGRDREGEWKLFYENGQVKEIGAYVKNKRDGLWRAYFEDGVLRGEIEYTNDHGIFTEYYHSGKVLAQGPKVSTKNAGHWRFFAEDGTLQSEGDYQAGKKTGEWITYYAGGQIFSKGKYENEVPEGKWEYFFENGKQSAFGEYKNGMKVGTWKTLNESGSVQSEAQFKEGTGEFREYYPGGQLKTKGQIVNGKKHGKWEYFYDNGKREGECLFYQDKGTYIGYFENGNLKTKGTLEGDLKTGTWEIYENDGKLAGYYRPFYDDRSFSKEIADLARSGKATRSQSAARKLTYFDARFNEFRGVIVEGNPIMMFAGRLPVAVEFYLQERLGHEFEFIGIRDPFFKDDLSIPVGKQFERGYSIALKQKFYNQVKAGMWYFGHEIRFTNYGHFLNSLEPNSMELYTFSAVEQRIEWGLLGGYRIMQRNNAKGFTIDAFLSANVGYRGFDVEPSYAQFFEDVNQSRFVGTLHFGLNFGRVFAFR